MPGNWRLLNRTGSLVVRSDDIDDKRPRDGPKTMPETNAIAKGPIEIARISK